MADVKLSSKVISFLREIGTVQGDTLCIPLSALESVATASRSRSDFDTRLARFKAVVDRHAPNDKGIITIPLLELVDMENPDNGALSLSQATSATTWAGIALGARLAVEVGNFKASLAQRIENRQLVYDLVLRPMTDAEIGKFRSKAAEAAKKAAKGVASDAPAPATYSLSDGPTHDFSVEETPAS